MLHRLKKYLPEPVLGVYHFALANLATVLYRFPSDHMIVIGVTGTKGKSSTVNFIAQLLTELGETVGYTSTAGFNIAGQEIENKLKMTMPGRFALQALMRRMLKAGCSYAVIETSSQGLIQYRHLGINYDVAVFTNLTPEHIEAHGGFENYKRAKGLLFRHLTHRKAKVLKGQRVPKTIVVNADSEHASYYSCFPADKHVSFSWVGQGNYQAHEVSVDAQGALVAVNDITGYLHLPAKFMRDNAIAAIATVAALGFSLTDVMAAAETLRNVPGRYEQLQVGQPFQVIIDYAYEPQGLKALFAAVKQAHPQGRILGIHGSAGGGRDVARRPIIGQLAAWHEDIVIVTNEDPYDDDPQEIIKQVADGARAEGKVEGKDLFIIEDRAIAIEQALALAKPGDIVLITGKGSEPVMAVAGGRKLPWSDKEVALKALEKMGYNQV
jgi:UDP-N-acetylmuramoyl-L-alanyl-D-glutamate--2,6-diaminopimelate ligase